MKMPELERLLSKEQKQEVIKQRIMKSEPDVSGEIAGVTYDRRFAFDFEVVKGPGGKARVTFALSIADPRFEEVVQDCARACWDIRFTSTTASAIRGGTREEEA